MPELPCVNRGRSSRRGPTRARSRRGALLAAALLLPLPATGVAAAGAAPVGATRVGAAPGASMTSPLLAATRPAGRAGATPAPSYDPDLYVLGPGDLLQLVFLDPTAAGIGGDVEILNDGTATFALLGSVQLTGLTIGQANSWLTSLYSKLLLRPGLYLRISGPRPMSVTVLGEVQTPGLYQLSPRGEGSTVAGAPSGSPGFPTLVTAIQKAGGITLHADVRNVLLRRRLPGTSGAQKQIDLNLAELLQLGNQLQNPLLFDGDTIVVGRATEQLPQEIMELGATNLTPQAIAVNVIGEVKAPGRVQLQANAPLSEAILTAGGPNNWRANKGKIELVRVGRNGTATREIFALDYTKGLSKGYNPPLRNNDTIIVNRSLYGEAVDVVNQLLVPLTSVANFWNVWNYFNYNTR